LLTVLHTEPNILLSLLLFILQATKTITSLSVQPAVRGSNELGVGQKWRNFICFFFQSREQVLVRRGQIREKRWVIKTLEAQVGLFLLGCKCLVSRGVVVQGQDPLGDLNFPRRFTNCPLIAPTEMNNAAH
jgi:hypothetical protein